MYLISLVSFISMTDTLSIGGVFMLKVKHVSKMYDDETKAIEDINLHVQSGDIYGFIGANGAGKSTTIKAIVGIHPFNEGEICIDGYSIKDDPVHCKKRTAFIPDNPYLYEHLTGLQYTINGIKEESLSNRKEISRSFIC